MCGIVGVTGCPRPIEVLLAGLETLEYRGYDSAGVVLADPASPRLWRVRAAEDTVSVARLAKARSEAPSGAVAGIAHTRWATHGAPTEANAHPHEDCAGGVAVVHNGIIENHRELAERLEAAGHRLTSETDTEVVAHLLEDEMATGADLFEAMRRCLTALTGDFALAAVAADAPETLVAARRASPLILGRTPDTTLLASDVAALLATTRELYELGDDEVALLAPGEITVVDAAGRPVALRALEVSWDVERAQKGGYPDFMSKEIAEQPHALAETLLGRIHPDGSTDLEELMLPPERLAQFERVVLVACGSSYHAALVGRHAVERLAGIPAEAEIASEYRYREPHIGPESLVVVVSQSGETVDTLHALREARQRGASVIAVTNVVGSLLAREADGVCYTRAGPEIGVASTKCHLAQLALLEVLALHLAGARGVLDAPTRAAFGAELLALPELVSACLARADDFAAVAASYASVNDFYFLGRRIGFAIAAEGALKLKELAYVRAEAYPAGEMKHGPISLIEPGAVVVAIATRTPLWTKVMANIEEVRARGATVIALCEAGDTETASAADAVLEVPAAPELTSPIVDAVPLQCLSYGIAIARGNDVDRPRNLAKVVTVE